MTVLSITSLFLLFPIITFFFGTKNTWETILASLLVLNIFFSFLFWLQPTPQSLLHQLDGFFAKLAFSSFTFYILCIKPLSLSRKGTFGIILLSASILFYLSTKESNQRWCSPTHILYHSLFHCFISIGGCFAFLSCNT
jgi:hypothetical protein